MYTDSQIKDYATKLHSAGASPQEIETFVSQAKGPSQNTMPSNSLLGNIISGLSKSTNDLFGNAGNSINSFSNKFERATGKSMPKGGDRNGQNTSAFGLNNIYVPSEKENNKRWENMGRGVSDSILALGNPLGYTQEKMVEQSPEFQSLPDERKQDYYNSANFAPWLANTVADNTVKPLGKVILSGLTAPISGVRSIAAGWNKPWFSKEQQDAQDKALAEPVDIPWFGNVNPFKTDEQGNLNRGKSALNILGEGADAVSGALNIANPLASSYKGAIARGGIQSLGKYLQGDEIDPIGALENTIEGGVVGGALHSIPDILRYGGQKLKNIGTGELRGQLSGLKPETIETLKTPGLGQSALDKIDQAKKGLINPLWENDPFQDVAQKQLIPAVQEIKQANKNIGEELASIINEDPSKFTTQGALDTFIKDVKAVGGRVKNGELHFPTTSRISESADVSMLNKTYKDLVANEKNPMSGLKYENVRKRLDGRIDYNKNTLTPITSEAEGILRNARNHISNDIKLTIPETEDLYNQLSSNFDILNYFNPKLGQNSSSSTTLRNLFSPAEKDNLRPLLESLGQKTGRNIINEVRAAKGAMDIAGDPNVNNLIQAADLREGVSRTGIRRGITNSFLQKIFDPEKAANSIVANSNRIPTNSFLEKLANSITGLSRSSVLANSLTRGIQEPSILQNYDIAPSPEKLIQKFTMDENIPKEKRQALLSDLRAGKISEDDVIKALRQYYGA